MISILHKYHEELPILSFCIHI